MFGLLKHGQVVRRCVFLILTLGSLLTTVPVLAQEPPYFVTYSQALEEPGSLEVSLQSLAGAPKESSAFYSPTVELEYGVSGWCTTELYVQGQSTKGDGSLFTGFRLENRFRLLPRELPVNPLLYAEFEDINGADKSLLEIVGNDSAEGLSGTNTENRREVKREFELKLLLSSDVKALNLSENFITEKNVRHEEPWEFGYALGVSRPLANYATTGECVLCRQNLSAGALACATPRTMLVRRCVWTFRGARPALHCRRSLD